MLGEGLRGGKAWGRADTVGDGGSTGVAVLTVVEGEAKPLFEMLLDNLAGPPAVVEVALDAQPRADVEGGGEERHVPHAVMRHLRQGWTWAGCPHCLRRRSVGTMHTQRTRSRRFFPFASTNFEYSTKHPSLPAEMTVAVAHASEKPCGKAAGSGEDREVRSEGGQRLAPALASSVWRDVLAP